MEALADTMLYRGPWDNGYCKRYNGKLWDECLNGEIAYSLKGALPSQYSTSQVRAFICQDCGLRVRRSPFRNIAKH